MALPVLLPISAKRGARHIGIAVRKRRVLSLARTVGMKQTVTIAESVTNEAEGLLRRLDPFGSTECRPGIGDAGDHQAVPVDQHLVVASGTHAFRSRFVQRCWR